MFKEASIVGMDCKVGHLANIHAFYHELNRGESMPMSDELVMLESDRRSLEKYARIYGFNLDGMSEFQCQILLLFFGCFQTCEPECVHLLVCYDGGTMDVDRLTPVLEELTQRVSCMAGCRLFDSRVLDPLHAVHLVRRDFMMGHISSACVFGLCGRTREVGSDLELTGVAALLLKPKASKGGQGALAEIPFSVSEERFHSIEKQRQVLADVLENRDQKIAHTLFIQEKSRAGSAESIAESELALAGILSCIESVLGLMQGSVVGQKAMIDPSKECLAVMARGKTLTSLILASSEVRAVAKVEVPQIRSVRDADVAIIGMSGRFPGSQTISDYWRNLIDGKETVSFFTPEELVAAGVSERMILDKNYVRAKPVLEDTDKFDSLFFGISPKEAELIDPQQRVVLEEAYHVFEDAGYPPSGVEDVGVYLSEFIDTYWVRANLSKPFAEGTSAEQFLTVTSNDKDYLATRVAYKLGLTGPALSVQTACSSSLVAVHLACEAVRAGDVSMALAGGVSLSFPQKSGYRYQEDLIYSPDGHCRPFDHRAAGTLFGEGVGMVLLKKLSDALRDEDPIYAVIKGSAINNDGNQKIDFTAPGYAGQKAVITKALAKAEVDAGSIGFVEAHGTGTKMGDPLEFSALTDAYRTQSTAKQYCALGSVKGNVGHLNTAAGVASLIKAVLCVKEGSIPATVNFEKVNPQIHLTNSPFYVNRELEDWVTPLSDRRAGISSFGIGGTNAHMIIEGCESKVRAPSGQVDGPVVFVLSAKNRSVLGNYAESVIRFLKNQSGVILRDLAYSFQIGREVYAYRLAVTADSILGLIKGLERAKNADESGPGYWVGQVRQAAPAVKNVSLGESWISGGMVDWESLYHLEDRPRRLSGLPTYPFIKARHWYEAGETVSQVEASIQNEELTSLLPVWNPFVLDQSSVTPRIGERIVVIGGSQWQVEGFKKHDPQASFWKVSEVSEGLEQQGEIDHLIWIAPEVSLGGEFVVMQVFRLLKLLLSRGYGGRKFDCTFITTAGQQVTLHDEVDPSHAAVHGLIGVLAKEYPQWRIRLLDLQKSEDFSIDEILRAPFNAHGDALAYRDGRWLSQQLITVREQPARRELIQKSGVYVIIGGSGGLGELWTRWAIENFHAQVVWIGRRPEDEVIRRKLVAMPRRGPVPIYLQADATDEESLRDAYRQIKEKFTKVHGVIHSAVDVFDHSLAEMDEERFLAILAAKISASLQIGEVFRGEALDFVLFFSSIASWMKGGGFAGYSAGCNFVDAYARRLERDLGCPVKVANWGYWNLGSGERVSEASKIRQQHLGIEAISPQAGMNALQGLLNGPFHQLALLRTRNPQVIESIQLGEWATVYADTIPSSISNGAAIRIDKLERMILTEGKREEAIDSLLVKLMHGIFQRSGLLLVGGFTVANLKSSGAIVPSYEHWMVESLSVLVRHGYLNQEGSRYFVLKTEQVEMTALWEEWDQQKRDVKFADKAAHYVLLEACLRSLTTILLGEKQATEVMFPDASLALVENIYKGNRVSDLFNDLLGDALLACIEKRLTNDPLAKLRILEVGAGTGGSTAGLLAMLQGHAGSIVEYCYTDVSKAFLFHAETHFAPAYPFLQTAIFDASLPLAAQGIAADHYDFVIATNVLHATRDIRQTLRNVKAALRTNGILLLNEISRKSLAAHLTFGLLDGWWLTQDAGIRMPGSPGLYPEQWKNSLECEGYRSMSFPAEGVHELGQQIVLAESDGVVRQDEKFLSKGEASPKPMTVTSGEAGDESLRDKGVRYFKKLLGGVLKMKSDDFDAATPLGDYGIDSIMIGQLNEQLRGKFENIRGTLLFEAKTINALVDHFLDNDRNTFLSVLGVRETTVTEQKSLAVTSNFAPTVSERQDDSIAIIGLSGRYADADNLEQFWENLKSGKDCVSEIPAERWTIDGFYCADPEEAVARGKSYSKWGSFVNGFADFDPQFFNITPREAMNMDPQERLFLQAAWHALEDAGHTREMLAKQYAGRVGVFAGVTRAGFEMRAVESSQRTGTPFPGVSFSSVANRVSYVFDLKGPSMAVDTMCSSSLTAIHEACERLRRGECSLAIAGGVNLYVHPSSYIGLSAAGMLSRDGMCRSFGKGSNGIVLGEGVGAVLLKPLSQAVRDGDSIHAVIRGSSVNHGGRTNGYTVPNPNAHEELIRKALNKAGIDARSVSYVEAHGTGTELGDPIEITGLTLAFAKDTLDSGFCAVGSAKSNLGHLEAAAGIAGLTKVILQMRHGSLVPSLHAEELNPSIAFEKTPFLVQRVFEDWKRPVLEIDGTSREYPRIAGVSSFGAGGVNAHLIVEEFREAISEMEMPDGPAMIVLSAKSELRLKEVANNLLVFLRDAGAARTLKLRDIAFTLQTGREAMDERIGFLVDSIDGLIGKLQSYLDGDEDSVFRGMIREHRSTLALFAGDEDIQQAIGSWVEKKKFEKILSLWVKGLSMDWSLLYAGGTPRRVQLPVYPFARERYWFDDVIDQTNNLSSREPREKENESIQLQNAMSYEREALPRSPVVLKERTLHELKSLFSTVIGLPIERIDSLESLESFGADSIMISQLNQQLGRVFEKLPKTLFFEYATLNALADYLIKQHEQSCMGWVKIPAAPITRVQEKVVSRSTHQLQEPIAIIGLSAHFAQADTVDEYWELLRTGRDCIREIPSERWSLDGFYERDPKKALTQGKSNGKWGSFLDGFADFDPLFFNISPQEALQMDPQERLFLQASWEVLEDAGYTPDRLAREVNGSVGVFVGITKVGYALHGPRLRQEGENLSLHTSFSSVANRVSYVLNLKGPSMPIDTMCSSSLTAIHEACERIRRGDCRMAIAGGVNLYLHPENFLEMSALQMFSREGKCSSFGAGADGMVPGEGVAAILLKPLSQAMAEGDQIHAVIRGSHVNHGGRTNGYSVPNPNAQADLIRETLDKSGVNARDISYVEAHGTGTVLGDPLEIEGLTRAFRPDTSDNDYCALGSAKSNIGHLEAAAGIAGLIKIVLQMKHGQLAPSLHASELNPDIDFGDTPFRVQQHLAEWKRPSKEKARIAGVSSFGAGGANAHVIVEEFLSDPSSSNSAFHQSVLVVLSAKNEVRLVEYAKRLHHFLSRKEASEIRLYDLAYTLQVGREAMEERLAVVVSSKDELLEKLEYFIGNSEGVIGLYRGQVRQSREALAVLSADEDLRDTMDQFLQRGDHHPLVDLWMKGLAIDWSLLYQESKPCIVSLPTYPFAKEQYWIGTLEKTAELRVSKSLDSKLWSLCPVWDAIALPEKAPSHPHVSQRMIVLGGSAMQQGEIQKMYPSAQFLEICADLKVEEIENLGPVQHIVWIASGAPVEFVEDERIIQEQETGVIQVFRLVKALLALGHGTQELEWTLVTFGAQAVRKDDFLNPVHSSLHGFVGSMAKEYPRWRIRLVDLEMGVDTLPESMWTLPPHPRGDALARRGAEWFEQTLMPVRESSAGAVPYRFKGAYVLIGGAGGIGEVVSRELIELYHAKVIWIGRRAMDAEIQAQLDALSRFGQPPHYITADARNRDELQCAYDWVKEKFGNIHGVYHSALGSYDQSLAEMEVEQFRAVISAKVDVCVRLAQVFQDEPLDFVVFFSSLAAFGKVRGMSGYAAACTFKDAFAHQLGKLWPCRSKVMNWGYWNLGGGARISETLRLHIEQTERILPIAPGEGMAALQGLLSGQLDQMAFLKTQVSAEMPGVRLDEVMTVYPETIPSGIDTLPSFSSRINVPEDHPGVEGLEKWMVRLLLLQLKAIGVSRSDLNDDKAILRRKVRVLEKHARWWDEAMKELERGESSSTPADEIWDQWAAFMKSYGHDVEMAGAVAVVDECFRKLPSILRGDVLTTDVLFPHGSMEKMEALYKDNSVSRYFNDVLAEFVSDYIARRLSFDPSAKIRILEIGAGTGGTTSVLLPHLLGIAENIGEYCYTDFSQAFLMKAEERYGKAYPFLRYQLCDIEKPLAEQGVMLGSYDIVVATNVLHATKQIRQTLRHAKSALAKNGLLVMNEMSSKTVFATILFGLIDGWSRAEDEVLRIPGSPGLLPETWQWLLEEGGFGNVIFPAAGARSLGQQIIVSESDGIVREIVSQVPEVVVSKPQVALKMKEEDSIGYVRQQICDCLSQSLRLPAKSIELDIPFSDYGVDSILGSQFINQLSEILGISLNTTIIFDCPTVNRLAKHLAEVHEDLEPTVPQGNGSTDIAVIGMSGQFPGAEDTATFWKNLISGLDCVGELPAHYLNQEKDYSPTKQWGKSYCRDGGILKNRECFDPLFFHLSPRDAESMNLHQRLVLQESWRALEDAGYNPRTLAESQTGAFVGSEPTGYFHETFTGASDAIIASRLSYFLDLRGPALVVNTGCSSSGVAIHMACESLRNGESTLALAGGVFAAISKTALIPLSEIEMLSPSGRCRTFDAEGDGMVLSEGVGMVVLKRLADAERDGDAIYGVIKASGMNQDGASNGITAPNGASQEALIAEVYRRYGIDPETISYVEAHGTGTPLGDPIEANALSRAFRKFTDKQSFCALGSAKAHIGHTAASAAVIGMMKVLLSMRHRKLPGLPHYKKLNPQIELEGSPFYISTETKLWESQDGQPLTAALSSFGHSGTNVHFVIREHLSNRVKNPAHEVIIPLSAKDDERLKEAVGRLLDYLKEEVDVDLISMAYTLQTGREAMSHRVAFVVKSISELIDQLRSFLNSGQVSRHPSNKLSEEWVAGGTMDWEKLYGGAKPLPLHLPTYPFARERYWIEPADPRNRGVSGSTLVEENDFPSDLVISYPEWMDAPAAAELSQPNFDEYIVITCGLSSHLAGIGDFRLHTEEEDLARHYEAISLQLFSMLKQKLTEKPMKRTLLQVLAASEDGGELFAGLTALLKTATQENPKLIGQWIKVNSNEGEDTLRARLEENAREPNASLIQYANGVRQVIGWREVSPTGVTPWKDHGVYLITGGAGGIGFAFAEAIAADASATVIILSGRSELSVAKQRRIQALERTGAVIEYRRVDVSCELEVQEMIGAIVARYGKLDGVLHSAGVNRDNYILKKDAEEFRSVLGPKVKGTVNLDLATAGFSLDFFVLFSSGAAVTGNLGQADYAAANGFMDHFAAHRGGLVVLGKRHGKSLSINWPLWKEGGMQVDPATEAMMRERTGMIAMPTAVGIEAFYQAMATNRSQVAVMWGDLARIRQVMSGVLKSNIVQNVKQVSPTEELHATTLLRLKELLGEQIKLAPERIASQEPLERYGIDSIAVTELNRRLEAVFGDISKTLFFEHQTLRELNDYFVSQYPEACAQWSGGEPVPVKTVSAIRESRASGGHQEPIAIIGLSGHYPQAETLDDFWRNFASGKDCITEIPEERWSLEGFFHSHLEEAVAQRKSFGKWGGFLDSFADFDPLFFNISPREALGMDPQERLFLQAAWEVLEDAGYTRRVLEQRFESSVGVFAGITKTGYNLHVSEMKRQGKLVYPHTSFSSVANRVSYFLNLRGPSMPIDTMCSSSLTAVHEACERLRRGDCLMAIAGGVNLYLHPDNFIELSALKMLAKDGKCRSFGKGGDGFVPGEGVGVVLLKPLEKALEDGDRIHAVIRGSHVNHGGKTNGYTIPNPSAQGSLIRETLEKAGVHARTVSYLEAHGTGTALGDPIEVTGLTLAFEKDTLDKGFCALGSAKSNIGHLEAAAGIAGLTKIILQMKHGCLFPSLHAAEQNPNIDFTKTPFTVQQNLAEWKRPSVNLDGVLREYPRIAGLSSFGAGGANAHVILEEYCGESLVSAPLPSGPYLIPISARNPERLRVYVKVLLDFVCAELEEIRLPDFAYTLQVGREAMDERLAMKVNSKVELIERLTAFLEEGDLTVHFRRGQVDHEQEPIAASIVTEALVSADYEKMLDLWVSGADLDWEELYQDVQLHRMGLPTYPFLRDRYWISSPPVVIEKSQSKAGGIAMLRSPLESVSISPSPIEKPRGVALRPLSFQPVTEKPAMEKPAELTKHQ
jgi:acyl transferase domain-containing protein/SAM-dependent methyltransferase/acyl carrier protein